MLWIVIGVLACVILLVLALRFINFEVRHTDPPRDVDVRVSHVSGQSSFVVKGPEGHEMRYKSLDEMPPQVRNAIEKAVLEGRQARTRVLITEDGKRREYQKIEDAPPEVQERIRQLAEDADHEGVVIEVNGQTHYFASADDVPPNLRKFLDAE